VDELTARLTKLKRSYDIASIECADLRAEIKHLKRKWARVEDYESDEDTTRGMSAEEWHASHG